MKKIMLCIGCEVVFSVLLFFILNLSGMTKFFYENYESIILHGSYVGETRVVYYLGFLYKIIFPICVLISVVLLYLFVRAVKYIRCHSKIGMK